MLQSAAHETSRHALAADHNVAGVRLNRPFRVRRLGHVGLSFEHLQACYRFYHDLLGFRISDTVDLSNRAPGGVAGLGDPRMYFTRCASDHHTLVFLSRAIRNVVWPVVNPLMDIQQVSWQIDSLTEVQRAYYWLNELGHRVHRIGRDMPGSNWHVYFRDPDGHTSELFYGMEQIGWDGMAKPAPMHRDRFSEEPPLPQRSEVKEIEDALKDRIDVFAGRRDPDVGAPTYDVSGVLLQRPFRVTRLGHLGLFVNDLANAVAFYTDMLGFKLTERAAVGRHEAVFLRASNEHHSLALYPLELKGDLGIEAASTCAVLGFQVANYQQLRAVVEFLKDQNVPVFNAPLAFNTGIDFAAHFLDPDGHVIRLYHAMEHVGWQGEPKPSSLRRATLPAEWPDVLEDVDGAFAPDVFLGPLG